jgi:exonuclease III
MRIVTYNLHYGGHTKSNNQWQRVLNEFDPDIVLAQESFNPADYFFDDHLVDMERSSVWQPLPCKWGSAILSPKYKISKIDIPNRYKDLKGWVVGGKIADFSVGGVCRTLFVFSIHAPTQGTDEKKIPYEKKVNEILDFIQSVTDSSDILIGGDFNITTAIRHPIEEAEGLKNTKTELAIIDRLRKEFGVINSWQVIHPNECLPQTLRWSGDKKKPYHCDGIFVPISWLRHLESCEVLSDDWHEMSDHNPVVATFS